MKPAVFAFEKAQTMEEAVTWLENHPEGKLIAGGQSLIPLMNFRLSRPAMLLDITGIPGLSEVRLDGSAVRIGALLRHQNLADNDVVRKHLPVLAESASHVGHWAIRNRGTLGGSLVHADPAAELPAAAVALDAVFTLVSADGVREVLARDFYLGFMTTDIQPGEILTEVSFPVSTNQRYGFAEVARRPGDFALAGAFVEVGANGDGAVTWFGIAGGPERRELTFAENAAERTTALTEQLDTVDILDDETYRRHAALTVAQQAYQRAMGGASL